MSNTNKPASSKNFSPEELKCSCCGSYGVEQEAYLVLNAFASWDVTEQLNVQANVNNLTDEKYINSLINVGYYGAPVNGTLALTYRF